MEGPWCGWQANRVTDHRRNWEIVSWCFYSVEGAQEQAWRVMVGAVTERDRFYAPLRNKSGRCSWILLESHFPDTFYLQGNLLAFLNAQSCCFHSFSLICRWGWMRLDAVLKKLFGIRLSGFLQQIILRDRPQLPVNANRRNSPPSFPLLDAVFISTTVRQRRKLSSVDL